jgi:hypothetical protein
MGARLMRIAREDILEQLLKSKYCYEWSLEVRGKDISPNLFFIYLSVRPSKIFVFQSLWLQDFLDKRLLLRRKLLCGRHRNLVNRYGTSVSQMTTDMFRL